jgi:hypothetical protein
VTPIEREMLAELRHCEALFRYHSTYSALSTDDQGKALAHANRVLRLITIASAPGSIKALPRGDGQWAAYVSGSPGRPLTALVDGLGGVCLYDTELEALQAASASLAGP